MSQNYTTDALTQGGQLIGHKWRMRAQNIKIILILGCVGFSFGFVSWGFLTGVDSWWHWVDFYLLSYLGSHAKIMGMKLLQGGGESLVHSFPVLAKSSLLMKAFQGANCLETTLYLPSWNQKGTWNSLQFVRLPWVLETVSQIHACVKGGVIVFVTVIVGVIWHFRQASTKVTKSQTTKGQTLISAKELGRKVWKSRKWGDIMLNKHVPLVKGSEVEHMVLVGATRMGKTNSTMHILNQIRKKGQRAVIVDLTGEYTDRFYRAGKDTLLNPLDERSVDWQVWDENLSSPEIDAFAHAVIPGGSKTDPIWHQSARKLLAVTVEKLSHASNRTMKDILQWSVVNPLDAETSLFYKKSEVSSFMNKDSERTAAGVRMNLASAIGSFKYLKPPTGEGFSITKWIADEKNDDWLFLSTTPSQRQSLAPLLSAWFTFAFTGLERLGASHDRRLWFVIDELPGLNQQISGLSRMVSEGAKYGACCIFGFQNTNQLEELYGGNTTRTILSNCSTKLVYRTPEPQTAEYMAQMLGSQEILESNESLSMGAHHMRDGVNIAHQRRLQPIVSASEIMELGKLQAYVSLPGNYPVAKLEFAIVK